LAPTSCYASTRKYIQCRQFVYRKSHFSVVRFATTQQHDRSGGSHLNCARWLWVEGRGEYSHDGGCGWLAPGDVRMYWLPQLQGLPPAVPPATCTSRQAQPGVGYNACIATHHRPPAPLVAGAVRGRSGGAPGCWGGSSRTPGAPVAPPTTQTTAPQESARKMLLISCML